MRVSFEHVVPVKIEDVLAAYGDIEFFVAKQKDAGALSVEVLETAPVDGGGLKWRARVKEPSRVPTFLRKSDVDVYVDESEFSARDRKMVWRVTPDVMADVFKLSGYVEFAQVGDSTRVTYNTEMEVKIPLVGKKAEKHGLAETESTCAQQARFLTDWCSR